MISVKQPCALYQSSRAADPTGQLEPLAPLTRLRFSSERLAGRELHRPARARAPLATMLVRRQRRSDARDRARGTAPGTAWSGTSRPSSERPSLGRDPADPDIVRGQLVPDRQQQAGREMQALALRGCDAASSTSAVQSVAKLPRSPIGSQWLSSSCSAVMWPRFSGRISSNRAIRSPSSSSRLRAGTSRPTRPERALCNGTDGWRTVDPVIARQGAQSVSGLQRPGDLELEQVGRRARVRIGAQQRVRQDLEVSTAIVSTPEIERARLARGIDRALRPARDTRRRSRSAARSAAPGCG